MVSSFVIDPSIAQFRKRYGYLDSELSRKAAEFTVSHKWTVLSQLDFGDSERPGVAGYTNRYLQRQYLRRREYLT